MTIQTPAFRYVSYPQEVIFAPGALARLYEKVELPPGWQRLMLCTSHSQRAAGWVSRIESILQSRLVALFDQVQPHVQDDQVREALGLAEAKKVDAVILDKTGTITQGMPEVTGIKWLNDDDTAKALLFSIEKQSEHPLADAVVKNLQGVPAIALTNFDSITGKGAKADHGNETYYVGNKKLIL